MLRPLALATMAHVFFSVPLPSPLLLPSRSLVCSFCSCSFVRFQVSNLYSNPPTSDFFITARAPSDLPSVASQGLIAANPDIVSLPIAASGLVAVYNLPEISKNTPLLIDRLTFSYILSGVITRWNDTRLQQLNPGLNMPNKGIIVVLPTASESSTQTWLAMKAALKFDPTWSVRMGGPITGMKWPDTNSVPYAATMRVAGVTGSASLVGATPYTFGFSLLSVTNDLSHVTVANMINQAGQVVQPTAQTLSYAFQELSAVPNADGSSSSSATGWSLDLCDGKGLESWPLSYGIGIWIPKSITRTTCKARQETVQFIAWFLGSTVISALAKEQMHIITPPLLYTTLNLRQFLESDLRCEETNFKAKQTGIITVVGVQLATLSSNLMGVFLGQWGNTKKTKKKQRGGRKITEKEGSASAVQRHFSPCTRLGPLGFLFQQLIPCSSSFLSLSLLSLSLFLSLCVFLFVLVFSFLFFLFCFVVVCFVCLLCVRFFRYN